MFDIYVTFKFKWYKYIKKLKKYFLKIFIKKIEWLLIAIN